MRAEIRALKAILETAVAMQEPPDTWRHDLERLKKEALGALEAEYREVFELLDHLEPSELDSLIARLPHLKFLN